MQLLEYIIGCRESDFKLGNILKRLLCDGVSEFLKNQDFQYFGGHGGNFMKFSGIIYI